MVKVAILIALLCLELVSARGFGDDGRRGGDRHGGRGGGFYRGGGFHGGNGHNLPFRLCSNVTWAQTYVTGVQGLLTQLGTNDTFRDWSQRRAQEFAYFQSATNYDLLATNCAGYFTGLDAARALDRAAQYQREQYIQLANRLFDDIFPNNFGRFRGGYRWK
ncbi:unnamed protein product [Rotaria sp. Silwood1]|nr:unnamed protein product [Rotaria sp. Silwood1]